MFVNLSFGAARAMWTATSCVRNTDIASGQLTFSIFGRRLWFHRAITFYIYSFIINRQGSLKKVTLNPNFREAFKKKV